MMFAAMGLFPRDTRTSSKWPWQCSAEAAFLRHCPTNFENDAAKTVPAGHLAHTEFWPGAGL